MPKYVANNEHNRLNPFGAGNMSAIAQFYSDEDARTFASYLMDNGWRPSFNEDKNQWEFYQESIKIGSSKKHDLEINSPDRQITLFVLADDGVYEPVAGKPEDLIQLMVKDCFEDKGFFLLDVHDDAQEYMNRRQLVERAANVLINSWTEGDAEEENFLQDPRKYTPDFVRKITQNASDADVKEIVDGILAHMEEGK